MKSIPCGKATLLVCEPGKMKKDARHKAARSIVIRCKASGKRT
jgi:hypothetical protein